MGFRLYKTLTLISAIVLIYQIAKIFDNNHGFLIVFLLCIIYIISAIKIFFMYYNQEKLFNNYILPNLTEKRIKFVLVFLDVFYGKRIIFYLNCLHLGLFTILAFSLRLSLISTKFLVLGEYFYFYCLFYFVFGFLVRMLDNVCVLIYTHLHMAPPTIFPPDIIHPPEPNPDSALKEPEHLVVPPNQTVRPTVTGGWTPQTSYLKRILASRRFRVACEIAGVCAITANTWVGWNNVLATREDIYVKSETNLIEKYRLGLIDKDTFHKDINELKRQHGR